MHSLFLRCMGLLAALLAGCASAQAALLTAAEATALLARSHAIDQKCQVLSQSERGQFTDYLARAEVLLAQKVSVTVAQAAIARGKAAGNASTCSSGDKAFVVSTFAAARVADEQNAEVQWNQLSPKLREPSIPQQVLSKKRQVPVQPQTQAKKGAVAGKVALAKPKTLSRKVKNRNAQPSLVNERSAVQGKKKAIARKVSKPVAKKTLFTAVQKPGNSESLAQYASVAQSYYKDLKCRKMSFPAAMRLYAKVLSSHKSAVAGNKRSAVRAVLRSAKAKANASSCS